jgi:hypothetical protein
MTPVITLTATPDAKATAVIEQGLSRFNEEQAGYSDARTFAVLVSDSDTQEVRAFGTIACLPPGTSRVFMVKDLD